MKKLESKKQTPLQEYLSRPLPPYSRGDGDCIAFVTHWANEAAGVCSIAVTPMTFGDIVRKCRQFPIHEQMEALELIGFDKTKKPNTGDIIVYDHPDGFMGTGIGIFVDGKAITRMNGPKLHVTNEPNITHAWTLSPKSK